MGGVDQFRRPPVARATRIAGDTFERVWAFRFALRGAFEALVGGSLTLAAGDELRILAQFLSRDIEPSVYAHAVALPVATLALGLGLVYAGAADFINRTRLTITATSIVRRDLPLPWRTSRTFDWTPATMVRSVSARKNAPQRSPRQRDSSSHKVRLVPPGGDAGLLFDCMSAEASVMLAAAITRVLAAVAPSVEASAFEGPPSS